MDLLRGFLTLFALVNAASWGALAAAWAFRPDWSERLPMQLGTHERYRKAAPAWARLALSPPRLWTLAAGLYLPPGPDPGGLFLIPLAAAAGASLCGAGGAAAAVYRGLKPEPLPITLEGGQQ